MARCGAADDIMASQEVTVEVLPTVYTVTFSGNGGTPDTIEVQVIENQAVDPLPTVTRWLRLYWMEYFRDRNGR